ncbi:hypothetical protein [Amycolatopsis sp. NPDC004079]|uniref:NACHT domain-containing protein n=1 Tax=Amycolatopsis sp. NPDC004079 TaxID=3154549 RepID=UPI0033A96EF0
MTDYRIDGLSTRTFEHLVQSLALDAVVSTVTPFGDGPDGGREATFTGLTQFGPQSDPWSGYGVIQAKFLQRPKTPQQDGTWIVNELRKELNKYSSAAKKRDLDYYILATNVTLTAVTELGTKDKVIKVLEDFTETQGLKGFDIWDYDKIRTLIDNNESVRKCYAAWITPGDVLMQLSDWLSCHRSDYHRLVVNYLQKELLSDQFARLEQAGHTAEESIPLAQVFVDLPITNNIRSTESIGWAPTDQQPGFVEFMAVESEAILVPRARDDEMDLPHQPMPGRYVLIGGPGQGKTTLGQYVCQIFRSSLLKDVPRAALLPETRQVMQAFNERDSDRFPQPAARRLPLRVVLSDFAAELAGGHTASLLTYLTNIFCKRTNSDLSCKEFQALVCEYPIILVLDGLDEVPASSNRDQVLTAIQDFSVDIASSQMDAVIIATSRPQGYNEDFSPTTYRHLWLTDLPVSKALEYGEKLAKVRFAGNSDRLNKIIGRLQLASRAPATARIMRSPLQVTILTLLVDRRGQLPQERWALFDEYYTLIYQRETERDIPAAAVLRERKDDIDAVHRLAGLLLQVESEASGSTDAKLTTEQFSNLVETYLRSEGHTGEALNTLRRAIIEGAATRLVFLVGLESGQVGFEIRSLQEFMAAEGLLDAPDSLVQNRLRAVARSANWRNVTVFAVGKIFAERRYLRDTVEAMCLEFNDDQSDRALTLTYAGSELALDLLEDGPVARHATKSRSLTRVALRLLRLPSQDLARRLAAVYQTSTEDVFREELTSTFEQGDRTSRKNAWLCLDALISNGAAELNGLMEHALANYTPDTRTTTAILSAAPIPLRGWRSDLAALLLPKMDPADLELYSAESPHLQKGTRQTPKATRWSDAAVEAITVRPRQNANLISVFSDSEKKHAVGDTTIIRLTDTPSPPARQVSNVPAGSHPGWQILRAIEQFERTPSKDNLADAIRATAGCPAKSVRYFIRRGASWPIAECQLAVAEGADSERLATAAEAGWLGDQADWATWQDEWSNRGIRASEFKLDVLKIAADSSGDRWFPVRSSDLDLSERAMRNDQLVATLLDLNSQEVNHALAFASINGRARIAAQRARIFPQRNDSPVKDRLNSMLLNLVKSGTWPYSTYLISNKAWQPPVSAEWADAMTSGIYASVADRLQPRFGQAASSWLWRAFQLFPQFDGLIYGMAQIRVFTEEVPTAYATIASLDFTGNPRAALGRAIIGLRSGAGLDATRKDLVVAFADKSCDLRTLFEALKADAYDAATQITNLLRAYDLCTGSPSRKYLAINSIRKALRRRQSELTEKEKWLDLGFDVDVREVINRNDSENPATSL